MQKINFTKTIFWIIAIIFAVIPFFWFKPGEIDLGGDSSRLYLYDPINYLKSAGLYSLDAVGVQKIISNQYLLPFMGISALVKTLFNNPTFINSAEKSVKLMLSFIFVYLIVKELLLITLRKSDVTKVDLSSIISAIIYTISPQVTVNMQFALLQHNQVFLNPMIFYFILKFLLTSKDIYLWMILLITFIYAPNFALIGPQLFAFYPIAFLFLFILAIFILKLKIKWRSLIAAFILFLILNSFHIFPVIQNALDPSNDLHLRAVETIGKLNPALIYFDATRGSGRVSINLLLSGIARNYAIFIIYPLIIIFSFITGKKITKNYLLGTLWIFVSLTLFLVSVNITNIGVSFYRLLYSFPGFSMFRNYGQFQWVFAFFYSITIGVTLGIIMQKLKIKYVYILFGVLLTINILMSMQFITGKLVNVTRPSGDKTTKVAVIMDPKYEETLSYVRNLPKDGKILNLPISDYMYQVVKGSGDGYYVGPSTISFLTATPDFVGYQNLYPFPNVFLDLIKAKKYNDLRRLFGLLNIRYIFLNTDKSIYEWDFPQFPYAEMRKVMPNTTGDYINLIKSITDKLIYENGPYQIFDLGKDSTSLISFPNKISVYKNDRDDWYSQNLSFFIGNNDLENNTAYVLNTSCEKYLEKFNCKDTIPMDTPRAIIRRINPSKIVINFEKVNNPFVLVFSNNFDPTWKVYLNNSKQNNWLEILTRPISMIFNDQNIFQTLGLREIASDKHFQINGYANAWLIIPGDFQNSSNSIIIETSAQKLFYVCMVISIIGLAVLIGWGLKLLKNRIEML